MTMSKLESGTALANTEQADMWNGREGEHWAEHARRYDRASRRHRECLVEAASINPTDVVLDVGCGTGSTTRDAARRATQGSALGIDLSAAMLDQAREQSRAEGIANVAFLQADAQVYAFEEHASDVAISSFGAMFFGDPIAAFANVGRTLRPGGRLTLLVWRELARNEWLTELRGALAVGRQLPEPPPGVPSLFALADPDGVRAILSAAGFAGVDFEPIDEPIDFGSDADDAFSFLQTLGVVEGLTRDLEDAPRSRAFAELRKTVDAHVTTDGVLFGTSAWLITANRP
jgi:SAM-dependent methyltransferase